MSPEEHDRAVANISHMPHVVSAALASCTDENLLRLTGDGWRDTTRIAGGDVELWRQIVSENRDSIVTELHNYSSKLDGWIKAIESNDQARIEDLLRQGKMVREAYASLSNSAKLKS
jgi:prephenate dehydrogenase